MEILSVLFLAGFAAGFIDSIAGGGGLISLPALLFSGLPPAAAIATSKFQSGFGAFSAALKFAKSGQFDWTKIKIPLLFSFAGAAVGSVFVQFLSNSFLINIIPVLLFISAMYFLFSPNLGKVDGAERISQKAYSSMVVPSIGFYDGFFGPGTGSFFALSFVSLRGFNLLKATAHTKALNFASNLAAIIFFTLGGQVVWSIGLVMAAGQFIGANLGARFVLRRGTAIIKPVLVLSSLAITLSVIYKSDDSLIHQALLSAIVNFQK